MDVSIFLQEYNLAKEKFCEYSPAYFLGRIGRYRVDLVPLADDTGLVLITIRPSMLSADASYLLRQDIRATLKQTWEVIYCDNTTRLQIHAKRKHLYNAIGDAFRVLAMCEGF